MNVTMPNGQVIEGVPDGLSKKELMAMLSDNGYDVPSMLQPSAGESPESFSYGDRPSIKDPKKLQDSPEFLQATREVYEFQENKPFAGDKKELAKYGLDTMGWFNYNLPAMSVKANRIANASQSQKEAFLYLMDSYDEIDSSLAGVGRFAKGVIADPTTYAGLITLGSGTAASVAAKQASRVGVRALLQGSLRTGLVVGTESAIYSGYSNTIEQGVRVDAGGQDEFSTASLIGNTALGFGLGALGGTLVDAGATRISRMFAKESTSVFPRATDDIAEGVIDTPPVSVIDAPTEAPGSPRLDNPLAPLKPRDDSLFASEDALFSPVKKLGERDPDIPLDKLDKSLLPSQSALINDVIDRVEIDDLSLPDGSFDMPYSKQVIKENIGKAMTLAEEMKDLHYLNVKDIVEELKTRELSVKELQNIKTSTNLAAKLLVEERMKLVEKLKVTTDPEAQFQLRVQFDEIQPLFNNLELMRSSFNSQTGYELREIQNSFPYKGISDKTTPEDYAEFFARSGEEQNIKRLETDYNKRIQIAYDQGDVVEGARLTVEKHNQVNSLLDARGNTDVGYMEKAVELSISNVFSVTTVMLNIVPSAIKVLIRPSLDFLVKNPLELATRKAMISQYSAMSSAISYASKAAVASFRYEQSILTRESGRLMDTELAIKGAKGGVIRIFPRLLSMTDEFISQAAYQGFVAGKAAEAATEEAISLGLKGKKLDDFIKQAVKSQVENSYNDGLDRGAVQVLINKGEALNLRGDALAEYVVKEAQRNGDNLKHGSDVEALDYVRDVLFKRAFSGDNFLSNAAQTYEGFVSKWPIMRLMGQLFFRTPVRVIEDGIRMTPGLQLIHPHFLDDILGKNGPTKVAQAQGEVLLSMTITGYILKLYAEGNITGDTNPGNWKQARMRTDTDMQEAYTIKGEDGETWNYKMFDPFATPTKIIVNALERYETLAMRQQQGETIEQSELQKSVSAITVMTGAIASAIRDANLMAGVDGVLDLAEGMADPEGKTDAMLRFAASKLRLLVPNTMHKIARYNDPELEDPATFWQYVETSLLEGATLGAYGQESSQSYDVLGNTRTINDKGALFNMFSTATIAERKKGLPEYQLDVVRKLEYLQVQANSTFEVPNKHRMTGDMDLRKTLTSDGEETLYDRWQRYYKELDPAATLQPLLDSGLPVGTEDVDGSMLKTVRSQIKSLRDASFMRLMAEEDDVSTEFLDQIMRKAEVQSGMWDVDQMPEGQPTEELDFYDEINY